MPRYRGTRNSSPFNVGINHKTKTERIDSYDECFM